MAEDYLTIAEVAARLKIKPKTIKNKMASGFFQRGVHYFSPPGLGPRFKWSAVVMWLEQSEQTGHNEGESISNSRHIGAHKRVGLDIGDDLLLNGQYVRR